ncbi:hypothetical protein EVJ50_04605 [Synechococcus sp. RSCCF101]|uniref:hypothetical protein n=1 Tax=Synechococcus sp. RSCCF101 TaxID=2511069 RepID=UPI001243C48F|nr:hypothetical protein [Synechococcus sp. RSCCF101]QEY31641.1 hypothetical protein EVJ50_04605 [Synechococcus sp. RSCCF101]
MGSAGRTTGSSAAGTIAISLAAGVVLGAAGLAGWLWRRAERRGRARRHEAMLFSSRLQDGSEAAGPLSRTGADAGGVRRELQERVEELNLAIDDVRRQLEALTTGG